MNPLVLIIPGIALVILIGILAWHFEKKRREALMAWAREMAGFQAGARVRTDVRRDLLAHLPRHRAVLDRAAVEAGWGEPLEAGRGRGRIVAEELALAQGQSRIAGDQPVADGLVEPPGSIVLVAHLEVDLGAAQRAQPQPAAGKALR